MSRTGEHRAPEGFGAHAGGVRPPAFVVAERDQRMSYIETVGTALFGDPPPGRSALDGWTQRGCIWSGRGPRDD